MNVKYSGPRLKIFLQLEEELQELFDQEELSPAAARQLAKLAVSLLKGLKKSVSRLRRLYFPEFSVKDVLKHLKRLIKRFRSVNSSLIKRFEKSLDKRKRVFIICDDFLIPRDGKKAYRTGKYRDPVENRIRTGHNIVDTIIASGGIEITVDFDIQPKNSRVPKTKRAARQLIRALSAVREYMTPSARIRVLMDGGYTNSTVMSVLRLEGVKYMGTTRRDKLCQLFGSKKRVDGVFPQNLTSYLTIKGKVYYYSVKTLNLIGWGRYQVFHVRRPGEKVGKFYLTNDLKMTPVTFLGCLHERWWIEQGHRDLKQFCGMKQLFVWKKRSVEGRIALSYLLKNILALLVAEAGLTLRDYPLEELVEKEFCHVEQFLIQSALREGFLSKMEVG